MKIVYATQDPPDAWNHAIFLAGPTPRDPETPSWRPEALRILEEMQYGGVVFVPEPENGSWAKDYTDQAKWEQAGLQMADKIVVWVPRDLRTMPAFTTNVEFGRYVDSGKVVLGHPEGAPKTRYLDWLNGEDGDAPVMLNLRSTLEEALRGWDTLPERRGGERWVPAAIFTTPMFQSWYGQLCEVGNRLDKARVLWTFRLKGNIFSYVLWVDIWIQSEGRHKANEWVFARTDVACVVLYRGGTLGIYGADEAPPYKDIQDAFLDSEVILVREFRSPARTDDGFIHELPGGGCEAADDDALDRAAREVYEETGIAIDKKRLRYVGSRQAVGTISTHQVHLYAVELTGAELRQAKAVAESGEVHGEDGPGGEEQAYVEVWVLRDLLRSEVVDWTTMGLVVMALLNAEG